MQLKNEQVQDIKASRDLSIMIKKLLLQMITQKSKTFTDHEIKFAL